MVLTEADAVFTRPLEDLQVVKGQNAEFTCEVDKLQGAVKWLKDGVPIQPSNKFELITDEDNNRISLIVNNVDFDDEAVYTCMCGRKQCTADLMVLGTHQHNKIAKNIDDHKCKIFAVHYNTIHYYQ